MNWGYIVIAYLSLFALGISDNIRGPLFPEILKDFALGDARGAQFFALSSFFAFIGSYGVRFLLKKINRIHALQIALLLMVIGLIGIGRAHEFSWLLVFAACYGTSLGLLGVLQNVLVTLGSTPPRRQRMLSGLHAIYGVSSFLAPLVVAVVASVAGNWRTVFWVVAVVPLLLMLGAFLKKDPSPSGVESSAAPLSKVSIRDHMAQIYLGFSLGLYVVAEILISSRLSLFIRREAGLDLQQSSYYLTGFFLCLLAGRTFFALIHVHYPLRRILSVSLILSTLCLILGLSGYPVFLMVSGATMAPFYPIAVAYIYQHFDKHLDSAVSSSMAIQSLLTVMMHAGVGFLSDAFGIVAAMWVGPAALILSFLTLNTFERIFEK